MYVLIRTDIPFVDQIVQAGHACLEAGFAFNKPDESIHLVVVCVGSETELLGVLERIGLKGVRFIVFQEPDGELGFTAACTEPLSTRYRREFRDFPLWQSTREVIKG